MGNENGKIPGALDENIGYMIRMVIPIYLGEKASKYEFCIYPTSVPFYSASMITGQVFIEESNKKVAKVVKISIKLGNFVGLFEDLGKNTFTVTLPCSLI